MKRLAVSGEWLACSVGLIALVLAVLAVPQNAFADFAQLNQCNIYCQFTYNGQKQTDCLAACQLTYSATCGSDCKNCGGNSAPKNISGTNCGAPVGLADPKKSSCINWCLCWCDQNLDLTWACSCTTGGYGGNGPPGF